MHKGLFICLLLLTACSSSTETVEQATGPVVSSQLEPRAPQAEDVLFANLLMLDGQWQVQSIGSKPQPTDLLKGEERLYIQTGKRIVMPDYQHYVFRNEEKRLFDCGQDVTYNKHTTYNPCTSQFTRNTKFGEGWFGWTKQLDRQAIITAIQQTGLMERAEKEIVLVRQERQRCLKLRQQAEQLAATQKLQLRVIDETGMYKKGFEHVQYDLKIKPEIASEGCEQELEKVKLSYDVGIEQSFNLVLELRGKDWNQIDENKLILQRAVAEADKQLNPTLYITGKKVDHYNLYHSWSNQDVEITWRTIDITNTDLRQQFDLRSLVNRPIEVQAVSFYINDHVVTQRTPHRLAPKESIKDLEHASRYFLLEDKIRQNVEAIKTIDNKSEQASFGIRLKYVVGGEQKTLHMSDKLQLTSIL